MTGMHSVKQAELSAQLENSAAALQWQKIGAQDHHGLCIPIFSLHSSQSAGVGEYTDLIPILTWLQRIGLDTLQLLPINDTGPNWSPYSAISAFALNPLHLGLAALPGVQDSTQLMPALYKLQGLSRTERVDYKTIQHLRENFLKEYFQHHGRAILHSQEYNDFLKQHRHWLEGFALFKSIKTQSHWESWTAWPKELNLSSSSSLDELKNKFEEEIGYHCTIQFLCFQQMQKVKAHADQLGIFIKGDIPILVDRESADLCLNPQLFDAELNAGAPPDAYSAEGQNWHFPLYNWEVIEKQNFKWWKDRLAVASNFYHIYRIDHVVGFFRIWAIPDDHLPTEGHFIPDNPEKALEQGSKLMRMMLNASPMLPIGEDLGTIPPEVRVELKRLGICGTKVMRWERDWNGDRHFIPPEAYPPLSVTTVSTHDSSTLQGWWINDSEEAKEFCLSRGWEYHAPLAPEYQFALLYNSHHTKSLFHINLLQEYLAIIPGLTHSSPDEERINLPGVISEKNWSYRFIPSAEELIDNPELDQLIQDLKK